MSMKDKAKKRTIDFLKDYNGPCPHCGYILKHTDRSTCSECGSTLSVQLRAPFRLTPWHALVLSAAVSLGVLFDRVFLSILGSTSSNNNLAGKLIVMFVISFVIAVLYFGVVWRAKNRFDGLVLWKRWVWYAVAVLVPIVVTAVQFYILIAWALQG